MAEIVNDETLQMYVEESREHLESIESDLLEIEEQGADIDEDLVNKVFRAAHSIKGGSGFLGLDTIKELSHKIENVLDLVRNLQLVPSSEVINTVLAAFDHLGVLLADVLDSNNMEIAEHVTALGQLTASNLAPEEHASLENMVYIKHPDLQVVFSVTVFDLQQGCRGGMSVYILAYDMIKDIQHANKVPMDIIKNLEDTGRIIDIVLGIDEIGDLDSAELTPVFPMYVLFATIIEVDLMGVVMGLPDKSVFPLNEDELLVTPVEITKPTLPEVVVPVVESTSAEPSPAQTVPPASVVKKTPKKKPNKKKKTVAVQSESIRVQVQVLDQLMNRAGELVLARNQMLQTMATGNTQAIMQAGQRIDLVTSELQEIIMLTRMQPVANIFSKFPRVVRDMANQLNKEMTLDLQGKEVELDKTIIEGLADPLTHLVRNSADHGIESPEQRQAAGKERNGTITLRAFHESGQVIIEIEDDGKGLDPEVLVNKALEKKLITEEQAENMSDKEKVNLIMMAGFSTAEKITDVSGRGVGMDVVKTNLDKMGGAVDIISDLGKGTVIRIKLPLTLAIIPSLLITSCNEHFAMPQVNVRELLRISAKDARDSIERIGGAEVLVLRGELIPLLYLNDVLSLYPMFTDPKTGEERPDRRNGLMDKRLSPHDPESKDEENMANSSEQSHSPDERRYNRDSDIKIVVVQAGSFKYGLVVDQLHDTVEIVVKPLGRHLKQCKVFAGATIMGDGHVALILDVAGLANSAELQSLAESEQQAKRQKDDMAKLAGKTRQTLLLFHNGPNEQCGVPLQLVQRIEQINQSEIEIKGGHKVVQYRGGTLPVYALEEVANVEMLEATEQLNVIIFVVADREFGLLAVQPLDILDTDLAIDEQTLCQSGVAGSAIINDQTTLLIDIYGMMESLNPNWFDKKEQVVASSNASTTILLAEDSNFFLAQVKQFVEESGYQVIGAEDGQIAWDILEEKGEEISLVLTDIEMPVMNGFELTAKIKNDERFSHLPVIALTSLAGEEDVARGKEVGIDEYQVKLDKEKLLRGISTLLPA